MTRAFRYLSVCSGIEAASVAWRPLDWRPLAFAEIEPFPAAVLAHRFPGTPNLGDMAAIEPATLAPFEILVGGTPCQAWSRSGLQKSLSDPRAQLAFHFVRLAHAAQSIRYVVWENVPGVLETRDDAFGCFVGRLVGGDALSLPLGYQRWPDAGMASGPWGRIAWRVLDAQHFGVPQRRPRLFVVGCPGTGAGDPAKVLFEPGGGPWDAAPPSHETGGRPQGVGRETISPVPSLGGAVRGGGGAQGRGRVGRFPGFAADAVREAAVATREPVHGPFTLRRPIFYSGYGTLLSDTASALRRDDARRAETGVLTETRMRRFTPLERERLQGLPDSWTRIPWRGRPAEECPDGLRSASVGNSMAVPVMAWLGKRIARDVARAGS